MDMNERKAFRDFECKDCICWNESHQDSCGNMVGQCEYAPPNRIEPETDEQRASGDAWNAFLETEEILHCFLGYLVTTGEGVFIKLPPVK
jgi:hypothetical protein